MNEDEFYKRLAQAKGERDQAMRLYLEACRARDEAQRALSAEVQQLVKDRDFLRDELKARLAHAEADAEQAVHNEAFMERQRIVAWIRAKHLMLSSLAIANCIEQGEHEG